MSASPELPGWLTNIAGFDSELWCRPIVCTHGTEQIANAEVLGAMFEHSESHTLCVAATDAVGIASSGRIAIKDGVGTVGRSPGSLAFLCPECGRSPRVPPNRLDKILVATRSNDPPWVDMSVYD